MKKKSLLTIAIVAVCLLALLTGALRLRRHYLPLDGPTCALYEKYKDSPGIKASYLRDYPINDTLAVDVTTLQATDSAGWETLKKDFQIVDFSAEAIERMKASHNIIAIRMTSKNTLGAPSDTSNLDNNNILAIDYQKHNVGYFYTRNKEENFQILHYHYNLSEK